MKLTTKNPKSLNNVVLQFAFKFGPPLPLATTPGWTIVSISDGRILVPNDV